MSTELEFTNRVSIIEEIDKVVDSYLRDEFVFHIINIYGTGGIGKSRLLQEIKKKHNHSSILVHELSFEIMDSKNEFIGLLRIRKLFRKIKCPLFDYAFRVFCDKFTLLTLSTQEEANNLDGLWKDVACDFIPYVIQLKDCYRIFSGVAKKYQYISKTSKYIEEINRTNESECLEVLSKYLAKDLQNNIKEKQIFLIDAYNLFETLGREDTWLRSFIKELSIGLIIISGRESLEWECFFKDNDYQSYELKNFNETDTRNLLKKYLPESDIPFALKYTECIPFYVNLVVQIYQEENKINWKDISAKDNIIVKFMDHFDIDVQKYIKIMCEVRIFDEKISEFMIRNCRINITREKSDYIYHTKMSSFCTKDHSLFKFHDILVESNHRQLHHYEIESYLNTYFLSISAFLECYSDEECIILFDNVLHLLEKNKEQTTYICIENALDVLLNIIDLGIQIHITDKHFDNDFLEDVQLLLMGFWLKKRSTICSKEVLEKIKKPNNFGRHKKSFDVLYEFLNSLLNGYTNFQDRLISLNDTLSDKESKYWYYGRIKNYLGESYMLQSNIKESVSFLLEHLQTLEIGTTDHYQTLRHLGHNYRFSFQLDSAIWYYNQCKATYKSRTALMDIYTNLAETYCYCDIEKCLDYCNQAIKISEGLDRKKALAKVYYAKAIALSIKTKEYVEPYSLIKQSEDLNLEDGYQAGTIFTYMAKAIIEVLDLGTPQIATIEKIHDLTEKLDVYKFFRYYIELLANRPNSEVFFNQCKWIIPEATKTNFENFIIFIHSL